MIFKLRVLEVDASHELLFEGPDISEKDWEDLCDHLFPKALKASLARWPAEDLLRLADIVDRMIPFLEAEGYKHIEPKRQTYFGGTVFEECDWTAPLTDRERSEVLRRGGISMSRLRG